MRSGKGEPEQAKRTKREPQRKKGEKIKYSEARTALGGVTHP